LYPQGWGKKINKDGSSITCSAWNKDKEAGYTIITSPQGAITEAGWYQKKWGEREEKWMGKEECE